MLEHTVKSLFKHLGLSFEDFDSSVAEYECDYIDHEDEIQYPVELVANYIDIQLHLKNCHA